MVQDNEPRLAPKMVLVELVPGLAVAIVMIATGENRFGAIVTRFIVWVGMTVLDTSLRIAIET